MTNINEKLKAAKTAEAVKEAIETDPKRVIYRESSLRHVESNTTGTWRWGVDEEMYVHHEGTGTFWRLDFRRTTGDEGEIEFEKVVQVERAKVVKLEWMPVGASHDQAVDKTTDLTLYVVTDGRPGPESCRFVELETADCVGVGPNVGIDWSDHPVVGLSRLGPFVAAVEHKALLGEANTEISHLAGQVRDQEGALRMLAKALGMDPDTATGEEMALAIANIQQAVTR
jgi:hypothetical protein